MLGRAPSWDQSNRDATFPYLILGASRARDAERAASSRAEARRLTGRLGLADIAATDSSVLSRSPAVRANRRRRCSGAGRLRGRSRGCPAEADEILLRERGAPRTSAEGLPGPGPRLADDSLQFSCICSGRPAPRGALFTEDGSRQFGRLGKETPHVSIDARARTRVRAGLASPSLCSSRFSCSPPFPT